MSCGDTSSLKRDVRMALQSKMWSGVNWVCGQLVTQSFNILFRQINKPNTIHQKIRAHMGIVGNEYADVLAKGSWDKLAFHCHLGGCANAVAKPKFIN
ncbi:hypothetical protein TNCV_439821 [Trichonephila clavipes]|nr:hypothetical protein TNCV_439821 [Trichonephila clavipes]